jgi:hypothetical protein
VCPRPRGTKYQRITIPSDATGPQEPPGLDARPPGGALARIQGWITSNVELFLLKKDAPIWNDTFTNFQPIRQKSGKK